MGLRSVFLTGPPGLGTQGRFTAWAACALLWRDCGSRCGVWWMGLAPQPLVPFHIKRDFCLFCSFWQCIFEVDNPRGKNQFHKALFEVSNFFINVSGLACYILCKAILMKRDRSKQKGNI